MPDKNSAVEILAKINDLLLEADATAMQDLEDQIYLATEKDSSISESLQKLRDGLSAAIDGAASLKANLDRADETVFQETESGEDSNV